MNSELAAQLLAAARGFDRVDVADEVGDGDVRGSKFFNVALFRSEVGDLRLVGVGGDAVATRSAQRKIWVVVNLAPGDVGRLRIEQARQCPQYSALCLAAQTEQDKVMARQDRVHQLGDNRIVIAHNAGKDGAISLQAVDQVLAQFIFDSTIPQTLLGERTLPQLAQSARKTHDRDPQQITTCE